MAETYIANTGINYLRQTGGGEGRAEPGDIVPAYVVKRSPWLLAQGLVTATADAPQPAALDAATEGGD